MTAATRPTSAVRARRRWAGALTAVTLLLTLVALAALRGGGLRAGTSAFYARFVGAFLDALRVERLAVIGNSLGGLVALHLALSDPERVDALVLSDSAGLGRTVNPVQAALSSPGGASWR